jgi:hypothetical protein
MNISVACGRGVDMMVDMKDIYRTDAIDRMNRRNNRRHAAIRAWRARDRGQVRDEVSAIDHVDPDSGKKAARDDK